MKRTPLVFVLGFLIGVAFTLTVALTVFGRLSAKMHYNTMTGGTKTGVYFGKRELLYLNTPTSTLEGVRVPLDYDINTISDCWVEAVSFPLYEQRSANNDRAYSYRAIILLSETIPHMTEERAQAAKVEFIKLLQSGDGVRALEFAKRANTEGNDPKTPSRDP